MDNQITKLSGLDITPDSQNIKNAGFYVPQLTTVQTEELSSDRDGLLVYNTTLNKLVARVSGEWVDVVTENPRLIKEEDIKLEEDED